jgi:hypothetical protein
MGTDPAVVRAVVPVLWGGMTLGGMRGAKATMSYGGGATFADLLGATSGDAPSTV